jgi:polyhydroxyalkanoate synthesis regulator phasin
MDFSKGFYLGLGIGLAAKDKLTENFGEFADMAKAQAGRSGHAAAEFAQVVEEELANFRIKGEAQTREALTGLGLATTAETEELRARVKTLETKLHQVEELLAKVQEKMPDDESGETGA